MINFLKQADIFYQYTPTQLELVGNLCQEVVFKSGDLIFQENSGSKELFVISQGEVDILIKRDTTGGAWKKRNCAGAPSPGTIFWGSCRGG